MKSFFLFLLSLSITFTSAYHFNFDVTIEGPEDTACTKVDVKKMFKGLKQKFERRGNKYLERKGFDGIFVDIDIVPQFSRRELTVDTIEELDTLSDEELAEELQHRRLPWTWYGSGDGECNGCPYDDEDGGRRNLRSLQTEDVIVASGFEDWMNDLMPFFMHKIINTRSDNEECIEEADDGLWKGRFIWEGMVV